MSNYIVLVKQVPDVAQITENAFDLQTGNLIRTRLPSVINELDAQALAFAHQMHGLSGDPKARIVVLTMGPPMAEEVLRYGLARHADSAVLLTDRALGGADTVATASPLAGAIRRIVQEQFAGDPDYFVISGMQSVDGDTAQVPAQVAEELGLTCIAYATDVELAAERWQFTRIISGGTQVVTPRRLPVVVTVARHEYPLFAGFEATRHANRTPILRWGASDIDAQWIGAKGSKTTVLRVFPPPKSERKCVRVESLEQLAQVLEQGYRAGGSMAIPEDQGERYLLPKKRPSLLDRRFEATEREVEEYRWLTERLLALDMGEKGQVGPAILEPLVKAAEGRFPRQTVEELVNGCGLTVPAYQGEVWVVAEHHRGLLHSATLELIGKARDLADDLDTAVGACLVGHGVQSLAADLIAAGADRVYVAEHPLLEDFDPMAYRKAVAAVVGRWSPQIVLFAATPQGRVLAPMVSYRLGCGLTADCTGLDIRDISRKGEIGILLQTRPALGGNVMATIRTKNSKVQMATARPGVMRARSPDASRQGRTILEPVDLGAEDLGLEVLKTERAQGKVNFGADIVVSGGKGLQNRDVYEQLVGGFCQVLRGRLQAQVEKGASRAAVEYGLADRAFQVGQTGTAIGPKVYVALGISGAIQHMIGVANAGTIVAINSDAHAPIFKQCDYYWIGTAEQAVPRLMECLGSGGTTDPTRTEHVQV